MYVKTLPSIGVSLSRLIAALCSGGEEREEKNNGLETARKGSAPKWAGAGFSKAGLSSILVLWCVLHTSLSTISDRNGIFDPVHSELDEFFRLNAMYRPEYLKFPQ